MSVKQVCEAWLSGYASPNTRAAYAADVRSYLAWCEQRDQRPMEATASDLDDYRTSRQVGGVSTATIARQFAALRAFYATAEQLGACADSPFFRRRPVAQAPSATEAMTSGEVRRLYAAIAGDPRLSLLVRLLLDEGLRLSEVLALDHDDVDGSQRSRRVRIVRHGRRRALPVSTATSKAIGRLRRATTSGPLLTRAHPGGHATEPQRLTRFGADFLLKQAAESAGIDHVVSANVLRATHAAMAHDAGEHIDDIRDRMGHRDVRTTRRYIAPVTQHHTTNQTDHTRKESNDVRSASL
jgi:site-specific recombinase XerD